MSIAPVKTLATAALLACVLLPAIAQERKYKNLQVLPPDIPEEQLGHLMLQNLRGLGLRRLAGEGCLFCHVGDLETPRSQWDYASDAKPTKKKARIMMAMVNAINKEYLGSLKDRVDSSLQVTCTTCHAGVVTPGLLDSLAWRLNRSKRKAQGHALIEANYAKFPNEYLAIEGMAFILSDTERD